MRQFVQRGRHAVLMLMTLVLVGAAALLLIATVPVFGNSALIVRSGSMTPAIGVGDVAVVRPSSSYGVGDVIAFRSARSESVVVTHRIVGETADGFITQGDANDAPDAAPVVLDQIIGRQLVVVPFVGRVLSLGKTRAGFLAFVVVPAMLVMVGDVRVIVREIKKRRQQAASLGDAPKPAAGLVLSAYQSAAKRVPARLYVDSVVAKVLLLLISVAVTIPSGLALYTDTEVSAGNFFEAAACFETDPFADAVTAVSGTYGHCCNAGDLASDTATAEAVVTDVPDSPPDFDFIQISDDSSVTVAFVDNVGTLSAGADVRIHTFDDIAPAEAEVLVSEDCSTFFSVGTVFDTNEPDNYVDVDADGVGVSFIQCVRILDLVAGGDPFPTLGFDLDAVEALHSEIQCEEPAVSPTPLPSPSPTPSVSPSPSASPSPSPAAVAAGDVVINEVMWMGSTVHSGDEWIELRNMTAAEISVEGWTIDNAGAGASIVSLTGVIPAGGFYLVSNFASSHPQSALSNSIVSDKTANISLLNDGEQLVLRDASTAAIDSTPAGAWPAGVNVTGGSPLKQSMSRNNPPGGGTVAGNWHTCTDAGCNDTVYWDTEGANYGTPTGGNL